MADVQVESEVLSFVKQALDRDLRRFEARRKKILSAVGLLGLLVVILVVGAALLPYDALLPASIIGGIILFVAGSWYTAKGYAPQFKKRIIPQVLAWLNPNLSYSPHLHVEDRAVRESGLVRDYARIKGQDLVEGDVDGMHIQFSLVDAQTGGNNNSKAFYGLFAVCDLPCEVPGSLTFLFNWQKNMPGGFLGQLLASLLPRPDGEPLTFGDSRFDQVYACHSTAPEDNQRLVTQEFRQRLLALNERLRERTAMQTGQQQQHNLSAVGMRLAGRIAYAALPLTAGQFEPRYLGSVHDPELIQLYVNDLRLGLAVLDVARALGNEGGGESTF